MAEVRFLLNGAPHVAQGVDPSTTLLDHLRACGHTGTKEGCAEGECGACAVALVATGPDGRARYEAVNACLVLVPAVEGREVVTVEGIARGGALHPCQAEMASAGGSQCGYCTPGFVVSLFAEYYRASEGALDPECIGGNLCRCTGYRPIREAAERLATIRTKEARGGDPHRERLARPAPTLGAVSIATPENGAPAQRFVRPTSLAEACAARAADPALTPISGGTDLVVEVNQRHKRFEALLSLEAVPELRVFEITSTHLVIGAGVPLAEVEERLHHDAALGTPLRMLRELLPLFSSRLIRTRGTFGGNLGTASPIGDGPPALLGLGAELVLVSSGASGEVVRRSVPLDAFFLDYRKTALSPRELIAEVRIPRPFPAIQRFYKVSKRKMDDISTVAAGFAMDRDERGVVTTLRLAFGGVAATPKRALEAERAVIGRAITPDVVSAARHAALAELSPIDDHRGTARYRRAMIDRLVQRFFDETALTSASRAVAP
ncbi:MAG: FAD binding domain-containing protein [Sandaracinus sp.]